MRDIADLARLIVRARATAPDCEAFAQWCARARDAMTDRGPQVARQVAGLRHGAQRAVLMSAAVLHGAHADGSSRYHTTVSTTPPTRCSFPSLSRKPRRV